MLVGIEEQHDDKGNGLAHDIIIGACKQWQYVGNDTHVYHYLLNVTYSLQVTVLKQ